MKKLFTNVCGPALMAALVAFAGIGSEAHADSVEHVVLEAFAANRPERASLGTR